MKKTKIFVVLLLIIFISTIIIGISNKKTFEEIDINDETQDKLLAIMIRDEEDKEYKKQNSLDFPNKENYRYIGSKCTDNEGNTLNSIRYDEDTSKVYLTTNKAVHCSMFFADALPASEQILKYSSKYLESEQDVIDRGDVLRRFQGTIEKNEDGTITSETDVNNYICFGTTDKDSCKEHADQYMYRIIGYAIDNDEETLTYKGQLKLQKKEALEEQVLWNSDHYVDVNFVEADIYRKLNNIYWNIEKYAPMKWKDIVVNHNWWYGKLGKTSQNGEKIFDIENGKANTEYAKFLGYVEETPQQPEGALTSTLVNGKEIYYKIETNEKWIEKLESKIGLINVNDYYLSVGKSINCVAQATTCKVGWLHLSNNDSITISVTKKDPPNFDERTMTGGVYGTYYGDFGADIIGNSGTCGSSGVIHPYSVRPVIYITQDIFLMGTGTQSDPYRIISPDLN